MSDDAELLRIKQESAIKEVKKLLGEKSVKNDGNIMEMLELTIDDEGNYNPQQAYALLVSRPNTPIGPTTPNGSKTNTTRKKTPPKSINPLTNRGTSNNNRTRRNITGAIDFDKKIITNEQATEKHTLESQLPEYLNGAKVDIIQRDGHCFFRSITHQLVDYGFTVGDEYQVVRNLIADYIDNTSDIINIIISTETQGNSNTQGYSNIKAYTDAIRKDLWGGQFEIQAIHDGCLSSLTDGPAFKIIVYSVKPDGTIGLHPEFLHTMPNGEEEQLITRWPIRLLFVGKNHFHRIYFDNLDRQKQNYAEETRNIGQNTGLPPSRPTTAQLKRMGLLESPRQNEWGLTPSEMEAQHQALAHTKDTVTVDENSNEYINLVINNLSMPFMIMGYQNGQPNLLYKSVWGKPITDGNITTYSGRIYIPLEDDINNRQFTRYPNPTMLNVDGKTIVNISLHIWANIWDDDTKDSGQKSLYIYMTNAVGVEKVFGTENADFTSISLVEKPILYMRHGQDGMAFSPDTGVIALDDNVTQSSCTIHVTDPTDNRHLILNLVFERPPKRGGKSRRRRRSTRKPRRRRTMRKLLKFKK